MSWEVTNDDGGPAFPCDSTNKQLPTQCGMSLRDWFAGQALAGIMANYKFMENIRQGFGSTLPHIPEAAYEMADAMLNARSWK